MLQVPESSNNALGLHIVQLGPQLVECSVDGSRALRYMGQKCTALPTELEERLVECTRTCEKSSQPKALVRSFEIRHDVQTGCIQVVGSPLNLDGEHIAHHLEGCDGVALMAVTLGMDNERALTRAQALSPLDGLMLDACSSSLVEEAACVTNAMVEKLAQEAGFQTTKRFSPGYGDLSLDIQPAFLKALKADSLLGIHVGPSQLMTPMKSITAIIGLKLLRSREGDRS